jgi:alpha-amylase/alpha-mannosidase (GH57 family)
MTRVALLWHMHQPYYEDLVTHEHVLPWVRLHALKDYYGMAALLEEFPLVRATFNLVPSLLVQLEAFAEDRARDRYLELGLKPADALTPEDVVFVLRSFFHAHRARMIDVHPRYGELLAQRGVSTAPAHLEAAARRFAVGDLRDLQVWQKLAWFDPLYFERDARVRGLVTKGRHFTEEDKFTLRGVELEILNGVIPAYRARLEAGQIEVSTSPFYHPILPLLCDADVYRRTHPDAPALRRPFRHPEDAAAQLERAAAYHHRLFGRRPIGLWPSEGSVSDAMVPLVAGAGFEWMATDEQILARSLAIELGRDDRGHLLQPERLYAPYRVAAGGRQVTCAFRDHTLSDLIGFTYAGWPAQRAADDFLGRLAEAGRRFASRTEGGEATVFVVLDGENAWEHFEGGGRPFLRALYGGLSAHSELRTVTMAEACRGGSRSLSGIFPGSWIDANFYIWIGHRDDRRAWGQLSDARQVLDAQGGADTQAGARAYEELLIAEGSDWFWWYGDDHSSEHDLEFDDLFRRHVRNAYQLMQQPIPDELFVSNISTTAPPAAQADPTSLLAPRLDGEDSSYFEWLGAGSFEVPNVAGSMHRAAGSQGLLTLIKFGTDRERLLVRIDAARDAKDLLAAGYQYGLTFLEPEGRRVTVGAGLSTPQITIWRRAPGGHWVREGPHGGGAAAASVLEVALPLRDLALGGGVLPATLSFLVTLIGPAGGEVERHPSHRPLTVIASSHQFEATNWTA